MLAGNTKIALADGSMKYIKELWTGEQVLTQNGTPGILVDTLSGMENYVMMIRTGNKEICASVDQTFLTVSGWKNAANISVGDKLLDIHGAESEVLQMELVPYDNIDYGLVIQDNHSFFAENIVAGDESMNAETSSEIYDRAKENDAYINEMMELMKKMGESF